MPSTSQVRQRNVVIVALIYMVLFSTTFIGIKFGVRYCPPLTLLTLRFLLAALFLGLFVRWIGKPWPAKRSSWIRLGILGLFNVGLPAAFNFVALRHASASMAAMIMTANPLLMALVAPKLLGERLTPIKIVGLLIGFGGVAYVMLGRMGAGGKTESPLGAALMFCAVLSLVTATILFKRYPPRESLLMVNVVQQLISGLLLVPGVLIFENPLKTQLSFGFFASLGHLVFIVSIGAPLLWLWLLERGEASTASAYLFLFPILGILFASITLNEAFTQRDGFGLVAVTIAILLIRKGPAAAKPAPVAPAKSPAPSE